jgi:hypothetical protein
LAGLRLIGFLTLHKICRRFWEEFLWVQQTSTAVSVNWHVPGEGSKGKDAGTCVVIMFWAAETHNGG